MKLHDIGAFEKKLLKNKYNGYPTMSINVYDYNYKFVIRPLRVSEQYEAENISIYYTCKLLISCIMCIHKI